MSFAAELIEAALRAADPRVAVARELRFERRAHVLAVGKAAVAMYEGAVDALGDRVIDALLVGKHDEHEQVGVEYLRGDHPVPGAGSARAGARVLEWLAELTADDHLILLLSGGASALLAAPIDGLSVDDIASLTEQLLRNGASIEELNTVRRELDVLKGGGLADRCSGSISTYVLSDVLGDPLEAIGSGPTAPNPTTRGDAEAVLRRYGAPLRIPNVDRPAVRDVPHVVVANCATALDAAQQRAHALGLVTQVVTSQLRGEARIAGARIAELLLGYSGPQPACLLAGGETTVTVKGDGLGGPNLELALAAVEPLAGATVSLTTFTTDGEDGPTDAAGATVDGTTLDRGRTLGLDVPSALRDNDAYRYFDTLGNLIRTGPTGTNVNDLVFGFIGAE